MISCAEATRRLWEYLDATVDSVTREAVEEHLAQCRRCCGELEFAEHLRGFLATAAPEELPPDVRRRLHQTLEELGP
jgi:mycothiol system anti-sigma-R factor